MSSTSAEFQQVFGVVSIPLKKEPTPSAQKDLQEYITGYNVALFRNANLTMQGARELDLGMSVDRATKTFTFPLFAPVPTKIVTQLTSELDAHIKPMLPLSMLFWAILADELSFDETEKEVENIPLDLRAQYLLELCQKFNQNLSVEKQKKIYPQTSKVYIYVLAYLGIQSMNTSPEKY